MTMRSDGSVPSTSHPCLATSAVIEAHPASTSSRGTASRSSRYLRRRMYPQAVASSQLTTSSLELPAHIQSGSVTRIQCLIPTHPSRSSILRRVSAAPGSVGASFIQPSATPSSGSTRVPTSTPCGTAMSPHLLAPDVRSLLRRANVRLALKAHRIPAVGAGSLPL